MNVIRHFQAVLLMAVLTVSALPTLAADSGNTSPAQDSINSLIAARHSPLPIGTRLESINIADGTATLDFSHELKDNFHGGDTDEANAVNSILKTMGQFPAVNRVQILVAGQPVESLGGMLIISDPLAVLRPVGYADAHKVYFHRRSPAKH
jgi:spore germination protein GerM